MCVFEKDDKAQDSSIGMAMVLFKISIGLGPHLFVKVPRPGDSEVTFAVFESSFDHTRIPVYKIKTFIIHV